MIIDKIKAQVLSGLAPARCSNVSRLHLALHSELVSGRRKKDF
jgi:hypothetical protein